jgi:hypothetical protein
MAARDLGRGMNRLPVLAVAFAAVLAVVIATAPPSEPEGSASPLLVGSAEGDLRLKNSKRGEPVLSGRNLAPGDVSRGKMRIRNAGSEEARVRLLIGLRDYPGPNGGLLSRALRLRVKVAPPRRDPGHRSASVIYDGRLAAVGALGLGSWRPGKIRQFRFRVRFPDRGRPRSPTRGSNAFQGSRARFRLVWRATAL